jgi:glucose dehydrogenase
VDALLALDARTGTLRWGRTEVCPDLWDYDAAQTPLLFTPRHGAARVVGSGNKEGAYWFFDAATGRVLGRSPALAEQSVRTTATTLVCPGKYGALTFAPPAYSPLNARVYAPGVSMCTVYRRSPTGGIDLESGRPAPSPARGFMVAIDAPSGRIAWRTAVPAPMAGGALVTAGGLVFSGADNGNFYAFDAGDGHILWKAHLGLAFGAAPITYAIDGVQYIAVAAGGSDLALSTGAPIGGTLVVFRLHGKPVSTLRGAGA